MEVSTVVQGNPLVKEKNTQLRHLTDNLSPNKKAVEFSSGMNLVGH